MIKVQYKGIVPSGYNDSGEALVTIFVDDSLVDRILEIAKYDAHMATDLKFITLLSQERVNEKPLPLTMIYRGIKRRWDSYFKQYFEEYDVHCQPFK